MAIRIGRLPIQRATLRNLALLAAATAFAVISYFLTGPLSEWSVAGRILTLIASVLGLAVLVNAIESALLYWWIEPITGDWYYHSSSNHFAHMKFSVRQFEVHYRVQTYDLAGIVHVLTDGRSGRGGKANQKGFATSRSVSFDGSDLVEILYEYSQVGGTSGLGYLRISGADGSDAMTGEWMATRNDPDPSGTPAASRAGTLRIFRAEPFKDYLQSTFRAELTSEELDVDA